MDLAKPLLPEFQAYTDKFGMVQITSDGTQGLTSDNGNLWTAFYALGVSLKGLMTTDETARLSQVYMNNLKAPGLLVRYPGSPDFEAQDDYCGMLMADSRLSPDFRSMADMVYEYGEDTKHCVEVDPREPVAATRKTNSILFTVLSILTLGHIKWNYNPVAQDSFSIYSWLGRRMELIAAIQMTARKPVNPIYWLYWVGVMVSNILSKPKVDNSVADILHYCNSISCAGYGPLTNLICSAFRRSVKRKFGDAGYMFGWSNQNPNHPIVSLLKGIY